MKKIIGYCRVSTSNQKEEGTIDLQRQALNEYAELKGYKLVIVFKDDGVSGGLENREGLADMFNYLADNKEVEGVLIFKLDRLARDLYTQEHIIKKLAGLNVRLISTVEGDLINDDPMRTAFRQFVGLITEFEDVFKKNNKRYF